MMSIKVKYPQHSDIPGLYLRVFLMEMNDIIKLICINGNKCNGSRAMLV